jgi:pSer/pThr/pTyr-binding forkhead associated (FHA) protein
LAAAFFPGIKYKLMWKLCVVDDESNRTMVKLVRPDYSIGRAEDSTIRLTERNISRSHARLYRENGAWMLEDRESFTGSFINGERVKGARAVKHGDTIQLGDYRLDLSDEEAEQAAAEAPPMEALAPAAPLPDRFIIVQGPDVGTTFALTEQKLLVGRGEECQIALDDASVSRVHLEVIRTEHGLMVLDQGSSNGLRINGTDLPSAMLRSGDLLELGDVRLRFVPAGVEDVPTAFGDGAPLVAEASPVHTSLRAAPARSVPAVVLFGVGVVALSIAIAVALRSSGEGEATTAASAPPAGPAQPAAATDGPTALLAEAKALAEQGAVVLAHRKLNEVPADSALRQSEEFKEIERRWADEIFRAAEVSPDPAERRRMLERIARTTALDPERRQRAAGELAKLDAEVDAVPVADLPNAVPKGRAKVAAAAKPRPQRKVTPTARAQGAGGGEAERASEQSPAPAPAAAAEPAAAPSAKPQEQPAAKPKASPQKEAKEGPELIRSIPF